MQENRNGNQEKQESEYMFPSVFLQAKQKKGNPGQNHDRQAKGQIVFCREGPVDAGRIRDNSG